MRRRGEGRTDWPMSQEEAMRRRADPEAPRAYEGSDDTITVELPQPKEQVTLRLDRDVLRWFRAKGPRLPTPHQRRPAQLPSP